MDLSIFLAKLLGIYLLIITVELLVRRRELERAIKSFTSSKGLLISSGSISLLFGLVIVIGHPVYDMDWQGLITLLGYVLIIRGIIRVAFPSYFQKKMEHFFHRRYWIICLVLGVLGMYLTYSGFAADLL